VPAASGAFSSADSPPTIGVLNTTRDAIADGFAWSCCPIAVRAVDVHPDDGGRAEAEIAAPGGNVRGPSTTSSIARERTIEVYSRTELCGSCAAMTSGGACTSSINTPSPPIGNCSLPFGWMKQMS